MSCKDTIKKMRRGMRTVRCLFFFTRNRASHTSYYYHRLKNIVGYEKWKKLMPPEIRQAWDSSSSSFDRQYGLIKAWSKNEALFNLSVQKNEAKDALEAIKKKIAENNISQKERINFGDKLNAFMDGVARGEEDTEAMKCGITKKAEELDGSREALSQCAKDLTALIDRFSTQLTNPQ